MKHSETDKDCHKDNSKDRPATSDGDPLIVGIGASAGGLAALEAFFAHLPNEVGKKMAFVVVQHLAPDYRSIVGELMEPHTTLSICDIADGMPLLPHTIYVCPGSGDLTLQQGRFRFKKRSAFRSMRFPIDGFFSSLAQDQGDRAVCILLSGGGTDGTQGLRAIKAAGGMTLVQDPDSAEHRSMPLSAIATELADHVLPPEKMPGPLADYLQNILQCRFGQAEHATEETGQVLHRIFALLHAQTGHNFSGYKLSTISRRIERRLGVHQIKGLDEYLQYLHHNPREVEALFREIPVGVTAFFRDPEAFEALEEKVIPGLFAGKKASDPVRVWVPGCSTGEEAYSLAILLKEYLERLKQPIDVQIFATDIDSRAIEHARVGLYPGAITADVSKERLGFFNHDPDQDAFQVQKTLRDMIVFAEQNVAGDPPFSGLDLISCRNLLIFMDTELQGRILHLFHYALNPEGFLFLGTSETTGKSGDLFDAVDRKWKIYRTRGEIASPSPRNILPFFQAPSSRVRPVVRPRHPSLKIGQAVERVLLERYAPAGAVIDSRGEIIYIHGRTGKYLEPAPGESNLNIVQMAREGLTLELAAAIRKAASQKKRVQSRGLQVEGNGMNTTCDLTVGPFAWDSPSHGEDLLLVVFEEVAVAYRADDPEEDPALARDEMAAAVETDADGRFVTLERELRAKEQYLQSVIEEMESSNEELQSTSEEHQSTNEELETSREELQSVNEELVTVNSELQQKVESLSRSNDDMNNMLAGTGVGIVFTDLHLRIERFTPVAAKVINLIQADVGRPIGHVASNLVGYDRLEEDVQGVLDTLVPQEVEVRTKEGQWHLMRILPYRTTEGVIEGAVINFIDITEMKRLQQGMSRLAIVVRDSNDAVTVHDLQGQILAWNPEAERVYGWTEEEALQMNIRSTVPEGKRSEALDMIKKLAGNEKLEPFRTERLTKDGETVDVWMTATILLSKDRKQPYAIATTERQVLRRGI